MQRDDTIRVLHILEAARKALHFVENRTRDDLDQDEMLAISLVHLLEIVGEAANCVSDDFREQHPHIPWKKMIELRNRLIHGYFDINGNLIGIELFKASHMFKNVLKPMEKKLQFA